MEPALIVDELALDFLLRALIMRLLFWGASLHHNRNPI